MDLRTSLDTNERRKISTLRHPGSNPGRPARSPAPCRLPTQKQTSLPYIFQLLVLYGACRRPGEMDNLETTNYSAKSCLYSLHTDNTIVSSIALGNEHGFGENMPNIKIEFLSPSYVHITVLKITIIRNQFC